MASPNTLTEAAIVHSFYLVTTMALSYTITKAAIVDSFHLVTLRGVT